MVWGKKYRYVWVLVLVDLDLMVYGWVKFIGFFVVIFVDEKMWVIKFEFCGLIGVFIMFVEMYC